MNNQSRETMFNTVNSSGILTAGGAFYVSNPAMAFELDTEKAYLNTAFTSLSVILKNGNEYQMPGRIRLVDQKVEVEVEGEVYELDSPAIQAVIDSLGRVYVPLFDPVARVKGIQWYEVAFAGKIYRLLVHESTVWQDPPTKNMFDTSEPRKTLKRVTRHYLVAPGGNVEIDKMKDLLAGLGKEERSIAAEYVRQERLRNDMKDYVMLMEYLEGR